MSNLFTTLTSIWALTAILAVLFIRGAHARTAPSLHVFYEPSSAFDDAEHDASARAGVVDVA